MKEIKNILICNDGCDRCSFSAARVTLPHSATVTT